jgi:hypothetical protein
VIPCAARCGKVLATGLCVVWEKASKAPGRRENDCSVQQGRPPTEGTWEGELQSRFQLKAPRPPRQSTAKGTSVVPCAARCGMELS